MKEDVFINSEAFVEMQECAKRIVEAIKKVAKETMEALAKSYCVFKVYNYRYLGSNKKTYYKTYKTLKTQNYNRKPIMLRCRNSI